MADNAARAQAAAAAAFEAKKQARAKAKVSLAENGKQDDPKNAWKADYTWEEGGMVDVLRMGVKSLKELLVSLGCPPAQLIDPRTGEDYVDREDILLRVAPKYLTLMASQQQSTAGDHQGMYRKVHQMLRDQRVPAPYDDNLIRALIDKNNGDMYSATADYLEFAKWSAEYDEEIKEMEYQQFKGFGKPPDDSKFFAQRRDDLRTRAAHEYWLLTHPPKPLPKTRPSDVKVAIVGEVKLPDWIGNENRSEEQRMLDERAARAAKGDSSSDDDDSSDDEASSKGSGRATRPTTRGSGASGRQKVYI